MQGNKKLYKANSSHPLFPDIHNIILKHVGVDHIIEEIVNKLGDVHKVFLIGDFAKGINSSIMDLIFVGRDINKTYLLNLVEKAEKIIKRKLRFMVFEPDEFEDYKNNIKNEEPLLLWQSE